MNDLLAQIILAARNRDGENWMNILVIVVIAVLYGLGGILKARADKLKDRELKREPPGGKGGPSGPAPASGPTALAKRPPVRGKPSRQSEAILRPVSKPRAPVSRTQMRRRRDVGRELGIKEEEAIRIPSLRAREKVKVPSLLPVQEPKRFVSDAAKKPQARRGVATAEEAQPEAMVGYLLDLDQADKLRAAILYHEILGKPVSLREPSEYNLGL